MMPPRRGARPGGGSGLSGPVGAGYRRPTMIRAPLLACALALLAAACQKQPAALRIKGPKEAVESTKAAPSFPVFEEKGATLQLRASAFDEGGAYVGSAKVKWDVSDRERATIDQHGLLTVLSSGKFEVVATTTELERPLEARQGFEAVIEGGIRIKAPVLEAGKPLKLPLGKVVQLEAEVLDDRGGVIAGAKVTWDCPSPAASVSITGEVEGRAIGAAQVFAESRSGKKVSWELDVTDWEK
jgi:hypothetical protein